MSGKKLDEELSKHLNSPKALTPFAGAATTPDEGRLKIGRTTSNFLVQGPAARVRMRKLQRGGRGVMETKASRGHVGNRRARVECGGAVRQLESLEIVRRVACFFPTLESILTICNC
jgi:hypothetical protein